MSTKSSSTSNPSKTLSTTPTPLDHSTYYDQIIAIDIVPVARELLKVSAETHDHLECVCPHHASQGEHSFHVSKIGKGWYCWGCLVGGDVLHLVQFVQSGEVTKKTKGKQPPSHCNARDWLAARIDLPPLSTYGLTPEALREYEQKRHERERVFETLTTTARYYHQCLRATPDRLAWLKTHYGFTDEIIDSLQIGWAEGAITEDSINTHARRHLVSQGFSDEELAATGAWIFDDRNNLAKPFYIGRYTFPYWTDGRATFMAGRETDASPSNERGKMKYKKLRTYDATRRKLVSPHIQNDLLYNEHILNSDPPRVILSEGITDCITLLQHGFPSLSPITVSIRQADHERLARKLKKAKSTVIIAYDNEVSKAGEEGAFRQAEWLRRHRIPVRILTLTLTKTQQDARDELRDKFGVDPNLSKSDVSKIKQRLSPEAKEEFLALAAIAKQDVNSYFLTFTPANFQDLIDSAKAPLAMTLEPYAARIVAHDTSILDDSTFLLSLSQAQREETALYQDFLDLLKKAKFEIKTFKSKMNETAAIAEKEAATIASRTQSPIDDATSLLSDELLTHGYSQPAILTETPLRLPNPYKFERKDCLVESVEFRNQVKTTPVHNTPIFVARRIYDIGTQSFSLDICFQSKKQWRNVIVPRATAFDSAKIINLANDGLWVYDENKKSLPKYLQAFEFANEEVLHTDNVSSQLGWISSSKKSSDTPRTFLYGNTALGDESIHFRAPDEGEARHAQGFYSSGSMSQWLEQCEEFLRYPFAAIYLYAALSAPLLKLIKADSFIIDLSAPTSTGKTRALRFALSAFGDPDQIKQTHSSTPVGLERIASLLSDLPLALDDSKTGNRKQFAEAIYKLTEGRGKLRGSRHGMAPTRYWRTVVLTTGEAPITEYVSEGGGKARVFTLRQAPFGPKSSAGARLVNSLNDTAMTHFGHIAPLFITHLISLTATPEAHADLYARYLSHLSAINSASSSYGEAGRFAATEAIITFTAQLLHESSILPFPYSNPFKLTTPGALHPMTPQECLQDEIAAVDIGTRALEDIISYLRSNRNRMGTIETNDTDEPPHGGWLGRWDKSFDYKFVGIFPRCLPTILKELNYPDDKAVIAAWKENDYLLLQSPGKGRKRQYDTIVEKWMQKTARFIAIKEKVVTKLEREYEEIHRRAENNPINADNIIEAEEQFQAQKKGTPQEEHTYSYPDAWDKV